MIRWTLSELLAAQLDGDVVVWSSASALPLVQATLPWPARPIPPAQGFAGTLIAVGGGTLLDEAKALKARRLIAVPSNFGSGAEVSRFTVLNRGGKKQILDDAKLLPHARVVWPELLKALPERLARAGRGDAWAHLYEGLLSPLASTELRAELAALAARMRALDPADHVGWLEASAAACEGQARSSVGLVHGIAHTLEAPTGLGHARLCAAFLWPVLKFDQTSPKAAALLAEAGLDDAPAREVFDEGDYRAALPALREHWDAVLRDPCTRTNCALVRRQSLEHFS